MARYYVNKNTQSNGDHEVHKQGCSRMPADANRVYLGDFTNCHSAVQAAKNKGYNSADGCFYCCRPCHKS